MKTMKLAGLLGLSATLISGTSFAGDFSCMGALFNNLARISYTHTTADTYSVKLKLGENTLMGHGYLTEDKQRISVYSLHAGKEDDLLVLNVNVTKDSMVGTAELKIQSSSQSATSKAKIVCVPTGN